MKPKTYNPAGLVTKKPIFLRLMPEELIKAEEGAATAGMSKSMFARECFLAGLQIVSSNNNSQQSTGMVEAVELVKA